MHLCPFKSLRSRPCIRGVVVLLLAAFILAFAATAQPGQGATSAEVPAQKIDLTAWGFQGIAPLARFTSTANLSLDFIDETHVLVTFNSKRLIQRRPECPPSHADRIIRAMVLDLSGPKSISATDWYLHDERPYIWPLGSGKFLLRRLNSLYVVDSELRETLLLNSAKELLWTRVTPDSKELLVATPAETSPSPAKSSEGQNHRGSVKVDFLDLATLAVKNTLQVGGAIPLEGANSGYADSSRSVSRKVWLVRYGPNPEQRKALARVKSPCKPDLLFPSNDTLMIGRCSPNGPGYSLSVFSLSGHSIWREHWNGFHHESALERSADGSRFAISTVVPSALSSPSSGDDEDNSYLLANGRFAEPDAEQSIQVLETATGHPVQVVTGKTVILGNRNFSLSPAGTRLAVIDGTELRIYNLPPVSREEMATYLAMKAGTPGLTPPMPEAEEEDPDDEPVLPIGTETANAGVARGGLAASGDDASADLSRPQSPMPSPTAAASGAADHQPTSDDSQVTAFRSRANEVALDVVVTDSKGRTVPGLSGSSFRVEEDGKPQPLTYFHEFSPKTSAPPADALTVPRSNIFTNQASSPGEPKVVLVLDFLNTPFADQQSVKQELLKFLKNKPAATPIALCVMTGRLEMLQGFTTDHNLLLAHLDSKKGRIRSSSELQSLDMKELVDAQRQLAAQDAKEQVVVQRLLQLQTENRAFQLDQRMSATVNAFAQLARYLSGIPGRKSIVWLSGSLPAGFFGNTSLNWDTPNASPVVRSYGEQLREATNLLAQAHIAVYPVDVRGFTVDSVYDSGNNTDPIGAGAPGSQTPGPPGRTPAPSLLNGPNTTTSNPAPNPLQLELEQQHNAREAERATMDQVAEETGGKAFYGNRIQQAVNAAVEQASAYYLLAYSPANRNYDGKFRKVKVSLEGAKYHLGFRRGYYAVDPQGPSKLAVAAAMR